MRAGDQPPQALRPLVEEMQETGLDHGEIVTLREEETVKTDAGTIHVVPAWRWMLAGAASGPESA